MVVHRLLSLPTRYRHVQKSSVNRLNEPLVSFLSKDIISISTYFLLYDVHESGHASLCVLLILWYIKIHKYFKYSTCSDKYGYTVKSRITVGFLVTTLNFVLFSSIPSHVFKISPLLGLGRHTIIVST